MKILLFRYHTRAERGPDVEPDGTLAVNLDHVITATFHMSYGRVYALLTLAGAASASVWLPGCATPDEGAEFFAGLAGTPRASMRYTGVAQ